MKPTGTQTGQEKETVKSGHCRMVHWFRICSQELKLSDTGFFKAPLAKELCLISKDQEGGL